jgi:PhnB protein
MAKKKLKEPTSYITPYLLYRDVGSALNFLKKAFGFSEYGSRFKANDGAVLHAAMQHSDGSIFMMGSPGPKFKNPRKLGGVTQIMYITVDAVDKHFARAKKNGAKIIEPPTDTFYGDRRYTAEDPEGHRWGFAQHMRNVSDTEMRKAAKEQRG